jgi:acetyltransferase-like isoleucine patch superfamily enzyme
MFLKFFKNRWHQLNAKKHNAAKEVSVLANTTVIGDAMHVTVGEQVSFGGDVILYANEKISIGSHTMIGMRTIIHTSTHDYKQHPMWRYRIDRPIVIGQHVWIGTSCIILAGVVIEDFAVIAAGSVVTANVPKGAIVGGNPAKIISYRDSSIYNSSMSIELWSEALPKAEGHINKWCKER